MKITELIIQLLAGGMLGMFGQVIRMFVGLTKAYKEDTVIDLPRLFSSLAVGFTSGGIGIFTITQWQADFELHQEDVLLLMSIGYAGTDFLEGIFRAMIKRTGTAEGANIQIEAIYQRLTAAENRLQASAQAVAAIKNGAATPPGSPIPNANEEVTLQYAPNADASVVSKYAEGVLKDVLRRSGHSSARITSTKRTPERQVYAMFQNLRTKGVASQRRLYGPYGDSVIDVYENAMNAGKSDDQIKQEMTERIKMIGPEKFSKHMGDFNKLVVVDIAPGSIANHQAFREAVEQEKRTERISKAITNLTDDPAFHLEIPNREVTAVLVLHEDGHDHWDNN